MANSLETLDGTKIAELVAPRLKIVEHLAQLETDNTDHYSLFQEELKRLLPDRNLDYGTMTAGKSTIDIRRYSWLHRRDAGSYSIWANGQLAISAPLQIEGWDRELTQAIKFTTLTGFGSPHNQEVSFGLRLPNLPIAETFGVTDEEIASDYFPRWHGFTDFYQRTSRGHRPAFAGAIAVLRSIEPAMIESQPATVV